MEALPCAACLGRPFEYWPSYTASISIELWATQDESAYFVRILYDEKEVCLPLSPPTNVSTWHDKGPWNEKGPVLTRWETFAKVANWSRLEDKEYTKRCGETESKL